jgi:MFS family permease
MEYSWARNKRTFKSVVFVLGAPLIYGMVIGSSWISLDTMTNSLVGEFGNTLKLPDDSPHVMTSTDMIPLLLASLYIGCVIGSCVGGPLAGYYGIRKTMRLTIPIYIISFLQMGFVSLVGIHILARLLLGVAVGINSVVIPIYICEIAPNCLRGFLGGLVQFAIAIGSLIGYCSGRFICIVSGESVFSPQTGISLGPAPEGSFCDWRLLMFLNLIPTLLLACGLYGVPESPRWLARKGSSVAARESMLYLRDSYIMPEDLCALGEHADNPDDEPSTIREAPKATMNDLVRAIGPISLGATLHGLQELTGFASIMYFSHTIIRRTDMHYGQFSELVLRIEDVVVSAIACCLVEKMGRRSILRWGAGLMTVGTVALAPTTIGPRIGWVPLMCIHVIIFGYAIGIGPVAWLATPEIIPDRVRALGTSIVMAYRWLVALVIAVTVSDNSVTNYHIQFLWMFCAIYMAIALQVFPETKGLSLRGVKEAFAWAPRHRHV